VELLKAAWDRGITTWDTANSYPHGESKMIIGKALKRSWSFFLCFSFLVADKIEQYHIPRHRVVILIKCFFFLSMDNTDGGMTGTNDYIKDTRDYVNQSGLSRAAIFNQVEASLERLGTSYINLL
jgi:aryl-alcohol dehydrogenase-like predicted oxidoreductase